MAIPEGYEKLAVVGMAWKGDYAASTAYKIMNAVYYEGSTYVALRDNPTGPPAADGTNWQYLAKGFVAALLSMITATDTSGIMGTAGADVGAQALVDAIARKVATELVSNSTLATQLAGYVAKTAIVQTESTRADMVPSSAYLKSVKDTLNSNLGKYYTYHGVYQSGNLGDIISGLSADGKQCGYCLINSTVSGLPPGESGFVTFDSSNDTVSIPITLRNQQRYPKYGRILRTTKAVEWSYDFLDIPAVPIPAGQQVITTTNLTYQNGDMPIAYGTGGHGVHMDIRLTVVSGKWNVTRRNTYSTELNSTGVSLCILR